MAFTHNEHRPEPKALALAVTGGDATLTMSSLEIAELTDKEHRNVMRDIRKMLDEMGEGGVLKFEHTHQNPQNGQTYPIFRLPKRECLILVSGYDVPLRAKIIDRWVELEAMVAAQSVRERDALSAAVLERLDTLSLRLDSLTFGSASHQGRLERPAFNSLSLEDARKLHLDARFWFKGGARGKGATGTKWSFEDIIALRFSVRRVSLA